MGRRRRPRPSGWEALRARIAEHGLRNSLLIAIAPTATIASIAGCYECIEPQVSNLFKRETLSGEFLQINPHLVRDLQGARPVDRRDPRARSSGPRARSRTSTELPDDLEALYRTAWELPQRALIDMAAERGAVHRPEPVAEPVHGGADDRQALVDVPHAWKPGLKTTYYLRSRPATRIKQTTTSAVDAPAVDEPTVTLTTSDDEAVACSLENPETCEACQ